MNDDDRKLIEQLVSTHQELSTLVTAHQAFEGQLDDLKSRRYLSDAERLDMARIKKQKLRGKDRILRLLAEHRRANG